MVKNLNIKIINFITYRVLEYTVKMNNQYEHNLGYNQEKFQKKREEFQRVKERLETLAERSGITDPKEIFGDWYQQGSTESKIFDKISGEPSVENREVDSVMEIHGNVDPKKHMRNISANYVQVGDEYTTFQAHFNLSEPLLLIGPKGCGKSLAIASWASGEEIPFITYDCSEGTKEGHLMGKLLVKAQNGVSVTPYHLGVLPTAIEVANNSERGAVLVLEEIGSLTALIQKLLNGVLDWRKGVYVEAVGKHISLKEGKKLLIVGTMNPTSYAGVNEINDDLLSRFTRIFWDYPSQADEKRILKHRISTSQVPEEIVKQFFKLASETRSAEKRNDGEAVTHSISTRELDSIFNLYGEYKKHWKNPVAKLLEKVRGMYEDEDEWKVVRSRIESIFGMSAFDPNFSKLSESELEEQAEKEVNN